MKKINKNAVNKWAWLSLLVAVVFLTFSLPLPAQENSCLGCHRELEDDLKAPADAFAQDVHQQFGLTCADCHGGDPSQEDVDLAKDKSFKGVPERRLIPEFCASCHSNSAYIRAYNPSLRIDQWSLYQTSQHGQLLKKGDTNVAVCTDCHGIHGIKASNNPKSLTFPWNIPQTCNRCHNDKDFMKDYGIPTDQWDDYQQSVHARALFEKKDLSAPVCNDCHGNHGAIPPEISSIAYVCRQCHPSTGELFSKSPHKKAFDEMGFSECESCHGNHKILSPSDDMLGTGDTAICITCHEPESKGYETAALIKSRLSKFVQNIQEAVHLIEQAEKQGVEVSEPKFKLQEATTLLVQVRNLTHGLSLEEIEGKTEEGHQVISDVWKAGQAALREAKFRRKGLVVATVFIFLFAIALFLKIRQMKKYPAFRKE